MNMTVRKLEVADGAALEKLVVEHVDSLEAGLSIIDTRLLLGHATIDLVAQDAWGSLVLIALGFRADEGMLLRIVDAYSWCLEYPESVKRHYPTLAVSEDRPPRVMFVMSRVPESFQRNVKQLSFPSVDAVEFHHLDINGVRTVFFDNIACIRRGAAALAAGTGHVDTTPSNVVAMPLASVPDISARPEPPRITPRVEPRPEPIRLAAEISARLGGNGAAPKVIETPEPPRLAVAPVVRVEAAVAAAATAVIAEAVRVIAGASDTAAVIEEPVTRPISFVPHVIDGSARLLDEDEPEVENRAAENFESEVAAYEASVAGTAVAVAEPEPAPEPVADPEQTAEQKFLFAEAAKAAKIAQDLGIQLPQEGALTRQWIDFLNQLAAK